MIIVLSEKKNIIIISAVFLAMAIIAGGFYLAGGALAVPSAKATASDNVGGWAWSENAGWFSFNNANVGGSTGYGVNYAGNGDITGRVWSENLGWISFERSEAGDPPGQPFQNNGALAKRNPGTGAVTGWMRVLAVCDSMPCVSSGAGSYSGGWDGWIRFCDDKTINCSGANQIATIDSNRDWHGWAWSDSVVGWLSLNSLNMNNSGESYKVTSYSAAQPILYAVFAIKTGPGSGLVTSAPAGVNCGPNCTAYFNIGSSVTLTAAADMGSSFTGWSGFGCSGIGSCTVTMDAAKSVAADFTLAAANNQSPTATNLSATQPDYRVFGPAATFYWSFSDPDVGDTQGSYQLQVATASGFSASSMVFDSGQVSSASGSYATGSGKLVYNQTYYWRVKVWDNHGADSGWISLPGQAGQVTTPKHQYPTISDLYWAPARPAINENTVVGAAVTCYAIGGGTASCPVGNYHWTFANGTPATADGVAAPQVKFSSLGSFAITLNLTDSDGYPAQRTENLTGQLSLPNWKEVAPH